MSSVRACARAAAYTRARFSKMAMSLPSLRWDGVTKRMPLC